jgi:uncharacterized protein YjiS (DUF1127 family)
MRTRWPTISLCGSFIDVSPITGPSAGPSYTKTTEADLATQWREHHIARRQHYVFDHPHWGNVAAQFAESRRCIRSCYEVMRLNERDLADMRLTSLDARSEMQKPFWET